MKCAEVLRVNLLALMHQNHKLWDIAEYVIQNSDLIIHISEIQTIDIFCSRECADTFHGITEEEWEGD